MVVTGRFLSAAESLVAERITVPFSADFLGADVIGRAGDPDIASALRRVPGLTVVDGKFVYVRGLGERYSSVTVNNAAVPSPELTRSVIPLDLFPPPSSNRSRSRSRLHRTSQPAWAAAPLTFAPPASPTTPYWRRPSAWVTTTRIPVTAHLSR